ncbi:MAG: hypothetical protein ACOYXB_09655 [Bacteroidota bacterium]
MVGNVSAMVVKYKILEKHHLLVMKWSGDWSMKAYTDSMEPFMKLVSENGIKYIISDLNDLIVNIKLEDIRELMANRPPVEGKRYKTVYLIDNPEVTAIMHLYSERFNKGELLYQYCITPEKAISLLSLQMSSQELSEAIESADLLLTGEAIY